MLVSKIFKCSHCGGVAHEFHGLEGGIYLSHPTGMSCPKGVKPDQEIPEWMEHDFVCVREVKPNDPPNRP